MRQEGGVGVSWDGGGIGDGFGVWCEFGITG